MEVVATSWQGEPTHSACHIAMKTQIVPQMIGRSDLVTRTVFLVLLAAASVCVCVCVCVSAVPAYGLVYTIDASFCLVFVPSLAPTG